MEAYIIKDPEGKFVVDSIGRLTQEAKLSEKAGCILDFESAWSGIESWRTLSRKGYKCVKVKMTEI